MLRCHKLCPNRLISIKIQISSLTTIWLVESLCSQANTLYSKNKHEKHNIMKIVNREQSGSVSIQCPSVQVYAQLFSLWR